MPTTIDSEDIYLLARDSEESARLNEQHRAAILNQGYVIHPNIAARLPPNPRVAEIATGSGAWILNAAQILSPEAKLNAYDISADQFPANPPANVSFSIHNAKNPFPSELHGQYDLVHIRALVAAMEKEDWVRVAQNVTQLLKPGGWLQWSEGDLSNLTCLRSSQEPKTFKAVPRLLELFDKHAHIRTVYGPREMPRTFESVGLTEVEVDAHSSDRDISTRPSNAFGYMIAILGWAARTGHLSGQELEDLRVQVAAEVKSGAYFRGETFTTIGLKP